MKAKGLFSLVVFFIAVVVTTGCSTGEQTVTQGSSDPFTFAIAWSDDPNTYSIQCMNLTAKELGENYKTLDMVCSFDLSYDDAGMLVDAKDEHGILTSDAAQLVKENTWLNSNVDEVMEGIDCVIFPGGKDISPTLMYHEQPWHGIPEETSYSAERDVSDYLLMSYCLDHDIPVLAICRGMQMLCVMSGADMIQDIGTFFQEQGIRYESMHRDPEKKDLVPHPIDIIDEKSLLYQITGQTHLEGCPSWHHQAVKDVSNTRLSVIAQTDTQGIEIIEGVQRKDRRFCLGLQFHPEVAVGKHINKEPNAEAFMDYDTAISFFRGLIEAGKELPEEEWDLAA